MGAVLRFITWVLRQAWRWSVKQIDKAVAWIRANWTTVAKWIAQGLGFETIVWLLCHYYGLLC